MYQVYYPDLISRESPRGIPRGGKEWGEMGENGDMKEKSTNLLITQ